MTESEIYSLGIVLGLASEHGAIDSDTFDIVEKTALMTISNLHEKMVQESSIQAKNS